MTQPAFAMNPSAPETGARLVSTEGVALPLRETRLDADAKGGRARVTLTQHFVNAEDVPLHVRYLLPLPSDGAVSGFAFTVDGRRILGRVERRDEARRRFQKALAEGRTAALVEEDRTSLFTQEVGNIPPGAEVVCEITVDQPLCWLAEGAWEWRFPTVVGPRYQGTRGRVPDARKLRVDVSSEPLEARAAFHLAIRDPIHGAPESTSHRFVATDPEGADLTSPTSERQSATELRGEGTLDRDVVVRWPVALPEVGVSADVATSGDDTYALLTVTPPLGAAPSIARDLIVLLDTSGSMGGRPLDQAKRVLGALIDTLGDDDQLELIAFGTRPERFGRGPTRATAKNRAKAQKWLRQRRASGGTEMRHAITEALAPLRPDAQRQIVLVTDGYIGFEREICEELLHRMPPRTRLHTVGVGSSVNRTLTEGAARAGRGTELVVGIDEDVERVLPRLLTATSEPLITELEVEGAVLAERAPDLYAAQPVLLPVRVTGERVVLRGRGGGGDFEAVVDVGDPGVDRRGVPALFGRAKVRSLETRISAGEPHQPLDEEIADVGVRFQIATRLTSWIAVDEIRSVEVPERSVSVTQPHELPHGVSVEGLGLRGPSYSLDAVGFATGAEADGFGGSFDAMELEEPVARGGLPSPDASSPKRKGLRRARNRLMGDLKPRLGGRREAEKKEAEEKAEGAAQTRAGVGRSDRGPREETPRKRLRIRVERGMRFDALAKRLARDVREVRARASSLGITEPMSLRDAAALVRAFGAEVDLDVTVVIRAANAALAAGLRRQLEALGVRVADVGTGPLRAQDLARLTGGVAIALGVPVEAKPSAGVTVAEVKSANEAMEAVMRWAEGR